MIRCNSFGRSLLFAAVAAIAWPAWAIAVHPLLAVWHAREAYLAGLVVVYVMAIADAGVRRLAIGLVVAIAAAVLMAFSRGTAELCIGLAVLLGVVRSGFLYRSASARALVTEAGFIGGGLLFAGFLGGPSLWATGLGLWGFGLVQSTYFLIGGIRESRTRAARTDPFDAVHARALRLLERVEV